MPKRARTEDEENCSGHLAKTHVSQKEVNLGVLREQNMAAVHERTLSLLYHRGTKASDAKASPMASLSPPTAAPRPSQDVTSYRQLSLVPGSAPPCASSCAACLRPDCRAALSCSSCGRQVGSSCAARCEAALCGFLSCAACQAVSSCTVCGRAHCPSCSRDLCTWH